MKTDIRKDTLSLLFDGFDTPYSFYILGSGASAGIVPTTKDLKQVILEHYFSFGVFHAKPNLPDDLFCRVIRPFDQLSSFTTEEFLRKELIGYLSPSPVRAMVIKALTPKPEKIIENPHAYVIFSFIKKQSTIFSMNVDGLASRYCIGHKVFEPHLNVRGYFALSTFWDEFIKNSLLYEINPPKINGLVLMQPEPKNITSFSVYDEARYRLKHASFVVFIGYSFAFFDRLKSFDDLETFEFFREELRKYYRKNVIVLAPDPEFISNAIEEATRVKIYQAPFYWNDLCQAIIEEFLCHGCRKFKEINPLENKILYRHDQLREEKSWKKGATQRVAPTFFEFGGTGFQPVRHRLKTCATFFFSTFPFFPFPLFAKVKTCATIPLCGKVFKN